MQTDKKISLDYRKKWLMQLKDIVLRHIETDKYAVFLYGSAVNNLLNAHDFDIGVIGKNKFPDKSKYEILNEVEESIIPFDVDIKDFREAKTDFKEIALKEIEVWNKPKDIKIN